MHLCHNLDEVCATGMFGVAAAGANWLKKKVNSTNIDANTNYTTDELNWLGSRLPCTPHPGWRDLDSLARASGSLALCSQ